MNISSKLKQIKKRSKKKKTTVPVNEKLNIKSIIDPKHWDGASNWAQLVKVTGIKVKEKKPHDIMEDLCNGIPSKQNDKRYRPRYKVKSKLQHCGTTSEVDISEQVNVNTVSSPTVCNPNLKKNEETELPLSKHSIHEKTGILKSTPSSSSATENSKKEKKGPSRVKFASNFKKDHSSNQSVDNDELSAAKFNGFDKTEESNKITKVVAMDCEMVGTGPNGSDSIIARVSIVNSRGELLYDEFVKPKEPVTDYRTKISGVRPSDLINGKDLFEVQTDVVKLIEGKILVGHSLKHDFNVLFISHPYSMIRDTSKYPPFRKLCGGCTPSLKKLTSKVLGVEIQTGEHSSIEDAQAALQIYMTHRREWEKHIAASSKRKKKKKIVKNEES